MAVYVVTRNLNQDRAYYSQARAAFLAQLDQLDNIQDPDLESVRWVSSNSSADQTTTFLRGALDDNDKLFVSKLNQGQHQGWLSQATWNWINARI